MATIFIDCEHKQQQTHGFFSGKKHVM